MKKGFVIALGVLLGIIAIGIAILISLADRSPSRVASKAKPRTEIWVKYTHAQPARIPILNEESGYDVIHAYVAARDPDSGRGFVTRAGKEEPCDPSLWYRIKSGFNSLSSSRSSSKRCPVFCEKKTTGYSKVWAYAFPGHSECEHKTLHSQLVSVVDRSFSKIASSLRTFTLLNNHCNMNTYHAGVGSITNNSNSYAFSVVEKLTGERPEPTIGGRSISNLSKTRVWHPVHGWKENVGIGVDCLVNDWPSLATTLFHCARTSKYVPWLAQIVVPSGSYCKIDKNRWIGGEDDVVGVNTSRHKLLKSVILQTTEAFRHFDPIGWDRNLVESLDGCLRTYSVGGRQEGCWFNLNVVNASILRSLGMSAGYQKLDAVQLIRILALVARSRT